MKSPKTKAKKIKLIDESINNPYRIVFGNVIFQAFREQSNLAAVFAFNKMPHRKNFRK